MDLSKRNAVIVTCARKPLSTSHTVAGSVLATGCGAINIDACRVGTVKTATIGTSMGKGNSLGKCWGDTDLSSQQRTGRFPSNMILQHRTGCCISGQATDVSARVGGTEEVPMWDCQPDCPVGELDDTIGVKSSGVGTVKRSSSNTQNGNQGSAYGKESRSEGDTWTSYGDSGYVSRFFYKVQT